MFDGIRGRVLRVLRVPHDPEPPAGAPGSVRVFRAGKNYYKLRLFVWGIGQVGAMVGIIFSLKAIDWLEGSVEQAKRSLPPPAAVRPAVSDSTAATAAPNPAPAVASASAPFDKSAEAAQVTEPAPPAKNTTKARKARSRNNTAVQRLAARSPTWTFQALRLIEAVGILLYLVQIPITYAMARLDFELRWYIVTDRSLRIRSGLASVQETTMSFANIQQVVVTQDPIQRLLGLSDVRVESAGGGGDPNPHGGGSGQSLHASMFHGVDNAAEIRDLILDRLRRFRETGLGDPEETRWAGFSSDRQPAPLLASAATLAAAQELLQEARALRRALSQDFAR